MLVKKIYNQTLFDFIILNYGNLEHIKYFLSDNSIDDILVFDNANTGDKFDVIIRDLNLEESQTVIPTSENIYKSKIYKQNIFDFILTHYGNLEFISQFIVDNNINDILKFGKSITCSQWLVTPQSNRVTETYKNSNYEVSTGVNPPTGDFNNDFNNDFFI